MEWNWIEGAGDACLHDEWRVLFEGCPDASPFQSPDWLVPWSRRLGAGRTRLLAGRRGGVLRALMPLEQRWPGCYRLLGGGNTDYLDALLAPDEPAAVLAGALGHFRWRVLELPRLPAESPLVGLEHGGRGTLAPDASCPVLPLDGAPRGSRRLQEQVRYWERRLSREGRLRVEWVDREGAPDGLSVLFRLHRARWRERRLPGVFFRPAVRAFLREACVRLAESGMLRLVLLHLDGAPAAAALCLARGTRWQYYAGGLDPVRAGCSPGSLLIAAAIRRAAAEGAREFDFLRGQEPYKYRWGAEDRPTVRRVLRREGWGPAAEAGWLEGEHRLRTWALRTVNRETVPQGGEGRGGRTGGGVAVPAAAARERVHP